MAKELDIYANRAARNYSRRELARRVLWMNAQWLIRLSPRPCFGWRRFVLRCFGAKVGSHVNTYPSTRIYFPWNLTVGDWSALGEDVLIYNLGFVTIGRQVTVSRGAHLCAGTHDYTRAGMPLLKPPIRIEDQVWICTEAFIGPGITVGRGAVVGARAVVTKSFGAWCIVGGNPAEIVGTRELCCSAPPET
jgi:putative colanic acid biosynthesis acetyltransferase WcaF